MSEIHVCGHSPLKGEIKIQGSKNGVLPMLAASVLQRGTMQFTNVPIIQDVICMMGILSSLGCRCSLAGHSLQVDASALNRQEIPEEYVGQMRSSILLMGPLLGRCGRVLAWQPGGCSIGKRPVDLHLMAFRSLGCVVAEREDGSVEAACRKMTGAEITFPFPSVGATENAVLAAVLAEGETRLVHAALEPEIGQLCDLLRAMGAQIRIRKEAPGEILIRGVKSLHETEAEIPGDRIVAGTYGAGVLACGGEVTLLGVPADSMRAVWEVFASCGATVTFEKERSPQQVRISMSRRPEPVSVCTSPYPGFPTDLQSPLLPALSLAAGVSRVHETVFEGRFAAAKELNQFGAQIVTNAELAIITGRRKLTGAKAEAADLRGGAALTLAALAAEGESVITGCSHIKRGYEDICRDLTCLGGSICILNGDKQSPLT